MADPRRSYVRVSYDGKDITEALTDSVLEFSYTDKASGESDEITLKLHDREGNWINDWYPKKIVEKVKRSGDYSEIAKALQRGVSTAELQKLIDASDLTPEQGRTLQRVTDSSTWPQYSAQNPQYRGESGKVKLIEDVKAGRVK